MRLSNIKNSFIQNDGFFWVLDNLDYINNLNHILNLYKIPVYILIYFSPKLCSFKSINLHI